MVDALEVLKEKEQKNAQNTKKHIPKETGDCTKSNSVPADQIPFDDKQILPAYLDKILENSESAYSSIVRKIVDVTDSHLTKQTESKNKLKSFFAQFFSVFLISQYVVLIIVLVLNAVATWFSLSENIIITYITSVFVETLGIVAVMIGYAFSSKQEVELIETLNNAISSYQKFVK